MARLPQASAQLLQFNTSMLHEGPTLPDLQHHECYCMTLSEFSKILEAFECLVVIQVVL